MFRFCVLLSLLLLFLANLSAVTVTGKVIGADGKPCNGVDVLLYFMREKQALELKADGAGNYAAEVAYNMDMAYVVAYAPGLAMTAVRLKVSGNVLALDAGTTVSGTVVDAAGKPVAGIAVSLLDVRPANGYATVYDNWRARFTVLTSADGAWTLPGIPRDGSADVGLTDTRYMRDRQQIILAGGQPMNPVSFTVRSGATVQGRIITPQGNPVADARVSVYLQDNTREPDGEGNTAVDGSYRVTGLATGNYSIHAASTQESWVAAPLENIALTEGQQATAPDIHTRLGALLNLTVVDADTGAPIPGTTGIELYHDTIDYETRQDRLITNVDGHLQCRLLPAKLLLLAANPPHGYLKQKDKEARVLELQEGQTATVTLPLHKGFTLTGTLSDGAGNPAAWVEGGIDVPDGNTGRRGYMTSVLFTTDDQGHFEAAGLPAGHASLRLWSPFRQPGAWRQDTPLGIEVPANAPIAVTLSRIPMRAISGQWSTRQGSR